jgi:hypothetical protein
MYAGGQWDECLRTNQFPFQRGSIKSSHLNSNMYPNMPGVLSAIIGQKYFYHLILVNICFLMKYTFSEALNYYCLMLQDWSIKNIDALNDCL